MGWRDRNLKQGTSFVNLPLKSIKIESIGIFSNKDFAKIKGQDWLTDNVYLCNELLDKKGGDWKEKPDLLGVELFFYFTWKIGIRMAARSEKNSG